MGGKLVHSCMEIQLSFFIAESKVNFGTGVGFTHRRFGERCEPNLLKNTLFPLREEGRACPVLDTGVMGALIRDAPSLLRGWSFVSGISVPYTLHRESGIQAHS
jgi:hypothetical protein